MVNKRLMKLPIKIILLNGKTIKSTHTWNLCIPCIPSIMSKAHIVPGLAHSSLISTHTKFQCWSPSSVFHGGVPGILQKRDFPHRSTRPSHWNMASTHQPHICAFSTINSEQTGNKIDATSNRGAWIKKFAHDPIQAEPTKVYAPEHVLPKHSQH